MPPVKVRRVPNVPRTAVGKAPLIKSQVVPGARVPEKAMNTHPATRWFMEDKDV
jgi:hypothetical protein